MAFGQETVQEKFKSHLPYRGQLVDVRAAGNQAEGIVEMAGLGWAAKKQPLAILRTVEEHDGLSHTVQMPWPSGKSPKFGIVRDEAPYPVIDGGKPCSEEFQLLDNRRIIEDMARFATDWGLKITYAGGLGGGEFVLAYASSPKLADLAPGVDKGYATHFGDLGKGRHQDPVEAGILMVASHQPGFKSQWIPKVTRFLCTNGVVIGEDLAAVAYKLGHREKAGEGYDSGKVEGVFERFERDFGEWCDMAKEFGRAELPPVAQRAYLAEVMDGELWERILKATEIKKPRRGLEMPLTPHIGIDELLIASGEDGNVDTPERLARVDVVEGLLGRDQSRRIVEELLDSLAGRSLGQVEEVMQVGPGQAGLQGLARPYHALTHWVDHQRGRKGGSAAVESAEWGPGMKLKQQAGKIGREWLRDLAMVGQAGRS